MVFIRRINFWFKLIRTCRGLDNASVLNLVVSAFFDVLDMVVEKKVRNPRFRRSGLYRISPYGFKVFARGGTEDLYYASPKRERIVSDFVRAKLENGDIFVDIGANIGYYTLLASAIIGDNGKVIAVEPIPETVEALTFNLKLNKVRNVDIVNKAAWHKKGKVHMEMPKGFFGLASGVVNYKEAKSSFQVESIPMDELLDSYQHIKLIKIDVEGAELQVLQGLRNTLTKTIYLVLEASTEREKIIKLLSSLSFVCQAVGFTDYMTCFNKMLRSKRVKDPN